MNLPVRFAELETSAFGRQGWHQVHLCLGCHIVTYMRLRVSPPADSWATSEPLPLDSYLKLRFIYLFLLNGPVNELAVDLMLSLN